MTTSEKVEKVRRVLYGYDTQMATSGLAEKIVEALEEDEKQPEQEQELEEIGEYDNRMTPNLWKIHQDAADKINQIVEILNLLIKDRKQ